MNHYIISFILILISFNCFSQKLTTKEKKGKIGFFIKGKKVLDFNYDQAIKRYKDFYLVRQEKKWGVISPNGKEIVGCKYDTLISTWGNGYIASLNNKYGVIDTLENIIIKFDYQDIDYVQNNNEALVKKNNKWAILKEDGTLDFNQEKIIFRIPERMPLFKFCKEYKNAYTELKRCADQKLLEYIYNNITYPTRARRNGTQGMAVVSFVVSSKGNLTDIKILRDPGDGCGQAAKKVVESMKKKWIPAKQDGKKVACKYNLPVRFKLSN